MNNYVGEAGFGATVVQLTGLAAWMADCLKIPQAISALLGYSSVAFALSFLRR